MLIKCTYHYNELKISINCTFGKDNLIINNIL